MKHHVQSVLSRSSRVAALSLIALFALACGDDDAPPPDSGSPDTGAGIDAGVMDASALPACGSPGRSGETPCEVSFSGTCGAGQYCDEIMLTCVPGCTDDANCGANDRCIRATGASVGVCETCPSCGDGVCGGDESATSCPADCGMSDVCGDGVCQPTESATSCPGDCAASSCGDGVCDPGEACPADCDTTPLEACIRACEAFPGCGAPAGLVDTCRGACGESSASEQADFAACQDDDCTRFSSCLGLECIGDAQCSAGTCLDGTCCGNGVCDPLYEDNTICPADCARDFLAECYEECDGFAFFGCGVGCSDGCTSSTPERRARFVECGNPVECNFDECSSLL